MAGRTASLGCYTIKQKTSKSGTFGSFGEYSKSARLLSEPSFSFSSGTHTDVFSSSCCSKVLCHQYIACRLHTLQHYADITAKEHGKLEVFSNTRTPFIWPKANNPQESGPYSNYPLVKLLARHAVRQFREVETLHGLMHLHGDEDASVIRTIDRIRQIIAFSKNRYYFGGMTNWPYYDGLLHQLEEAVTLMSLVMEHSFHFSTELSFSLDDPIYDVMNTIFDRSVELGTSNQLVMIITNIQSVSRTQILSIPLSDTQFCLYDKLGNLLRFQSSPDFDSPAIFSFEVTVPAASSITVFLRRCNPPMEVQSVLVSLDSKKTETRIGNPDFGVLLSSEGRIKKVYLFDEEFRFSSEVGYYLGGDSRTSRAGLYA